MKKVSVRTMWQGKYVSVRESEVEEAKNMGGLEITFEGNAMQLSPDDLSRLTVSPRIYQCKYNKGKTYRLVNIVFKPKDIRQTELFNL